MQIDLKQPNNTSLFLANSHFISWNPKSLLNSIKQQVLVFVIGPVTKYRHCPHLEKGYRKLCGLISCSGRYTWFFNLCLIFKLGPWWVLRRKSHKQIKLKSAVLTAHAAHRPPRIKRHCQDGLNCWLLPRGQPGTVSERLFTAINIDRALFSPLRKS